VATIRVHAVGGIQFGVGEALAVTLQAPWQQNESVLLLVNCGEGARRHCNELRLKMRHMAAVCFTSGEAAHTSGLSSVLFHLSDAGCQGVSFLGPERASHSLDAAMEVFGRKFPVVSRELISSSKPAAFSHELLLSHVHQVQLEVTSAPDGPIHSAFEICVRHRNVMQKQGFEVLAAFKIDSTGSISAVGTQQLVEAAGYSDTESALTSRSTSSTDSDSSQCTSTTCDSSDEKSSGRSSSDSSASAAHLPAPKQSTAAETPHSLVPVLIAPPVPLFASMRQQHFLGCAAATCTPASPAYLPPFLPPELAGLLQSAQVAAEAEMQHVNCPPSLPAALPSAPATVPATVSCSSKRTKPANASAAASLKAMLRRSKGTKRPRGAEPDVSAAAEDTGAATMPLSTPPTQPLSVPCSMPEGAIDVRVLGTGAATPSALRGNTAVLLSSSVASAVPGVREPVQVLLDCGEGTSSLLARQALHILSRGPMQVPPGAVDVPGGLSAAFALLLRQLRCVWISHHHADHMSGLHLLLHLRSTVQQPGDVPLTIIVPRTLLQALQHMAHTLPPGTLQWQEHTSTPRLVLARGPTGDCITLHGFNVRHCHRAQGAVVDFNIFGAHRRVSFSGDTMPCERLHQASAGCHLLLHEATFHTDEQQAARKHHSTTEQAIQAAAASDAGALVLMHFSQRFSQAGPDSPSRVQGANHKISCAPAYDGLCIPLHTDQARDHALAVAHAAHSAWVRFSAEGGHVSVKGAPTAAGELPLAAAAAGKSPTGT